MRNASDECARTLIKFNESDHFIVKTVENTTEEFFSILLLAMLQSHTVHRATYGKNMG